MTAPNGEAVVKVENLYKRFGELEVLRGINKVRGEWALICTAHNLAKLTA